MHTTICGGIWAVFKPRVQKTCRRCARSAEEVARRESGSQPDRRESRLRKASVSIMPLMFSSFCWITHPASGVENTLFTVSALVDQAGISKTAVE